MCYSRKYPYYCHGSLRCSQTSHKIPGIVRLRNGPQKLVLISHMDTQICVSISDWPVSYTPCDWSHSCKIYHAMLKTNIIACILYVLLCFALSDSSVSCINVSCHQKEKLKSVTFLSLYLCLRGHFMLCCYKEEFKVE